MYSLVNYTKAMPLIIQNVHTQCLLCDVESRLNIIKKSSSYDGDIGSGESVLEKPDIEEFTISLLSAALILMSNLQYTFYQNENDKLIANKKTNNIIFIKKLYRVSIIFKLENQR